MRKDQIDHGDDHAHAHRDGARDSGGRRGDHCRGRKNPDSRRRRSQCEPAGRLKKIHGLGGDSRALWAETAGDWNGRGLNRVFRVLQPRLVLELRLIQMFSGIERDRLLQCGSGSQSGRIAEKTEPAQVRMQPGSVFA